MSRWTQIREITLMNLRSIPERLGPSLVIVVGIAGVVGVLVALLSMSAGLQQTLGSGGRTDQVVVTRGGSNGELSSFLSIGSATLIQQDPAIARDAEGMPLASAELIVITEVPRPGQRTGANVTLRGLPPVGLGLREDFRITQGRLFRPGVQELIVGAGAAQQFAGLEVGRTLRFRGSTWTVVGHFAGGGIYDSELWSDVGTVQSAWRRAAVSSVLVQLARPAELPVMAERLRENPQLDVEASTQLDFYKGQSGNLTATIGVLAGVVAVIMAFGAAFGALNTMYSAVSARTREIGTLRALGFGAAPVLVSVMAEALLLSLAGGLLGALLAYAAFNGYAVSTLGGGFTQIAFEFAVTPALVGFGLGLALLIGFIGGLAPALRAARIPVTSALRE
ncbi:ABC transporter permease [Silanimonas sp.]|uniref:ABC transporter permease n=1 Tax=Silanimonas sp. TaxID=1929290 RepID=UPI001BC41C50|nr:ABC transporter permease [Silanimonas sp.]MBS3895172.1 ABC transporter permease [Silanimonas sp.]MBS3924941.1 ABC transporter permease [Xanthomonadaceae bacterium]